MKRTGTKEQAESILRELPSVLGAFVREDVQGNPREVHLLVAPGPDVRHLARDIRSLLEERLGVAVDQRIISIAQLSDRGVEIPLDLPVGGSNRVAVDAAGEPPAEPTRPGYVPEDVPTATPGREVLEDAIHPVIAKTSDPVDGASAPAEAAAVRRLGQATTRQPGSEPAPEPRLVFSNVESWSRDGRAVARVELSWRGSPFEGEAHEIESPPGRVRAAAVATMRAAAAACRGTMDFQIEGASMVRVFDREFALVSALAASPALGRRPLPLVGAHPVERDPEEAAVLASLKAIARVAGLGLEGATR